MLRSETKKEEKDDKKDDKKYWFQWFQNSSNASTSTPSGSVSVCNGDQCSIRPPQALQTSSAGSPNSLPFVSSFPADESETKEEDVALSSVLPPDYLEAMKQAAKQGFLYAFVSSVPAEMITDYFKQHKFTQEQIKYANQAVRALAVISLSAYMGVLDTKSLAKILCVPVATLGLKAIGFKDSVAQMLTMGAMITNDILNDTQNIPQILLTFGTSAVAGMAGSKSAQLTYNFTRNSLFALKNQLTKLIAHAETPEASVKPSSGS